jgi:hypothetical protein
MPHEQATWQLQTGSQLQLQFSQRQVSEEGVSLLVSVFMDDLVSSQSTEPLAGSYTISKKTFAAGFGSATTLGRRSRSSDWFGAVGRGSSGG